jgi:acyl-lipid omega-6 desaturase (Delta-12 desaturase)
MQTSIDPSAAVGLPSRKELRQALLPFSQKCTATALRLIAVDYTLFFLGLCLIAAPTHWLVKLAASILVWVQIARLFIIGHDACHQSLTSNRSLNKWLGRLVFLPSLTPSKLWELGHNMEHHGFTNLRGKDYVWAPFSPVEFAQLPGARQWLERLYRSGSGHWLYYLIELWWKRLFFPSRHYVGVKRSFFMNDCLMVSAFGAVWIGSLIAVAYMTQQSAALLVFFGFVLPFVLWNGLMGFIIYVHHTDPRVIWHQDGTAWAKAKPHITATIHIQFPRFIGAVLHNIMEHPAHHLDMTIPLYNLQAAQKQLDFLVSGQIIKRRFTWREYRNCARICKLFDFEAGKWVQFSAAEGESILQKSADDK